MMGFKNWLARIFGSDQTSQAERSVTAEPASAPAAESVVQAAGSAQSAALDPSEEVPITIDVGEMQACRIILDAARQAEVFMQSEQRPLVKAASGERKCIVLLALSAYGGRFGKRPIELRQSTYAVQGRTTAEYSGRYQLEVIPQYIMKECKDAAITDVEFIILETDLVHTPPELDFLVDNRRCKAVMPDGSERNPTEAEYFIHSTRQYIDTALAGRVNKEHVRFVEYYLSDDPRRDMPNLMDLVRREAGGSATAADIYIDIHGGPRGTQQLLISLLSILGEEGILIDPDHIFTVDGSHAPITVAGESFRVNEFVSGIHEFTNYGRMNSLSAFYEQRDYRPEELLRAMKAVSYAIQVCDMAEFERALPDLAAALTEYRNTGNKEDYLYSFLDLLVRGYDPLIIRKGDVYYADTDSLKEIKWCRDKGLYQQMLTLCESAIPRFLATHPEGQPIIRYDPALVTRANEKKGYNELYNYLFNHVILAAASEDQPLDGRYRAQVDGYPAQFPMLQGRADWLLELLRMHAALKKLRNHSNHGSLDPMYDDAQAAADDQNPQMTEEDTQEERHGQEAENYLDDLVDHYLEHIEDLLKMQTDSTLHTGAQRYIEVKRDSLWYEMGTFADYLKNARSLAPDLRTIPEFNGHPLRNENLRNLYALIRSAAEYDDIEDRIHVLDVYDQTLVREIYEIWHSKDGNTLDYESWLREVFLRDSVWPRGGLKRFWQGIGELIYECRSKRRFQYRVSYCPNRH